MNKKLIGILIENRILIEDIEHSRYLYSNGYFGKPIGVPKPRGIQFDSSLVLDLIEGYYLLERKKLSIFDSMEKEITSDDLRKICRVEYNDFDLKYMVYKELREFKYVLTSGIKFGCDFALYEHGPGIDHAPFLVQVYNQEKKINAIEIVLAGRLATTVKKQFIIAIPKPKEKIIDFIGFDWWRA